MQKILQNDRLNDDYCFVVVEPEEKKIFEDLTNASKNVSNEVFEIDNVEGGDNI